MRIQFRNLDRIQKELGDFSIYSSIEDREDPFFGAHTTSYLTLRFGYYHPVDLQKLQALLPNGYRVTGVETLDDEKGVLCEYEVRW